MIKRKKPKVLVRDEHGDLLSCGECHASYFANGNFANGRWHNCALEKEWQRKNKKVV